MATLIRYTLQGTVWRILTNRRIAPVGHAVATRHDGLTIERVDGAYRSADSFGDDIDQLIERLDARNPPLERRFLCQGCKRTFDRGTGHSVVLVLGHHGVHPTCSDNCAATVTESVKTKE